LITTVNKTDRRDTANYSVGDRLFQLSREYENKKTIAKNLMESARKKEVLSSIKSSSRKRRASDHGVENRLYESGKKTKHKIDHLK
jgi:hypothetical protein